MFALFSGLIGTAFSVLIRIELAGPGVQYIADNQLYNSIITAHAILMIFFMVMPAMIGGFGNFLLPLDRKSTRLNSSHEWISYAVFCLKKKNIKNKQDSSKLQVQQRKYLNQELSLDLPKHQQDPLPQDMVQDRTNTHAHTAQTASEQHL